MLTIVNLSFLLRFSLASISCRRGKYQSLPHLFGAAVFIVLVVFVVLEVEVASPLPRFFADLSLKRRIIQVDRYNTVSRLPEYLLTDF